MVREGDIERVPSGTAEKQKPTMGVEGGRRKEAQYKETEMWFYEILQSPLFSFLGGWSDHAVGSPLGPSCTLDGLSW